MLLYVALGGAAGAVARFAVGAWVGTPAGAGFPWATLAINTVGSLLLGFLLHALPGRPGEAELRALLGVGFCGAFTTFSTFGYETVILLRSGAYAAAAAYMAGSVVLSVVGVFGGGWLAGRG
ncbi:MAG TPA: fluoride efflux transporter CrcB [Longimicrobiaceae bacterium]|nr:fluoride efflux transporter CrcB [Longimicrobiaceae bacterium]